MRRMIGAVAGAIPTPRSSPPQKKSKPHTPALALRNFVYREIAVLRRESTRTVGVMRAFVTPTGVGARMTRDRSLPAALRGRIKSSSPPCRLRPSSLAFLMTPEKDARSWGVARGAVRWVLLGLAGSNVPNIARPTPSSPIATRCEVRVSASP